MSLYGFALISSPIRIATNLPYVIDQYLKIDKPTSLQLSQIRKYLSNLNKSNDFRRPFENINYLESEDKSRNIDIVTIGSKKLKKRDWLYYVVKYKTEKYHSIETPSLNLSNLQLSAVLQEKQIRINPVFCNKAYYCWSNFTEDYDYYFRIHTKSIENNIWYLEDLNRLKSTYDKINSIMISYEDIYRSIKMYYSLPKLTGYDEFMTLGLFSIIESILTHNPKSDVDSIGHQITSKVKLLSNRFTNKIDYSFFHNVNHNNIWKKLYEYRSKIAHGGRIDFKNSLKMLEDSYTVQQFLEMFLKLLLRSALNEPQLYLDLKEC